MATQTVFPTTTFPAGTRTFGPFTIAQGVTHAELVLDRTTWTDPALRITLGLDLSLDGGTTWASTSPGPATNPFPVAAQAEGGILTDKNGQTITQTSIEVPSIPSPSSTTRKIRAMLTNTLSFTTSGTLVIG